MNQNELKELIELVAEKGFAEFELEHSGLKLRIVATTSAPPAAASVAPVQTVPAAVVPAPSAVPVAPLAEEEPADTEADLQVVRAPIVGTFYRAPSPSAEPFVKIGDRVDVGAVLCIIEAMKLMNEIEADVAGTIVKIFADNAQPVEFGQPLFGIKA
jgi:acetyl-CoA carboxylase biotin carboxyl carrier protein